jgi:ankyrin repeat protein
LRNNESDSENKKKGEVANRLSINEYTRQIKMYNKPLCHYSEIRRKEVAFVLAFVRINGLSLEHADPLLKKNRIIVMAAVKQNGLALMHASEELQADHKVILAALNNDCRAVTFIDKRLLDDKNVVRLILKKHPHAVHHLPQYHEYVKEYIKRRQEITNEHSMHLTLAVEQGHKSTLQLLLDNVPFDPLNPAVFPDKTTNHHENLLTHVAIRNKQPGILKLLLERYSLLLNTTNGAGESPLHLATRELLTNPNSPEYSEIFRCLLSHPELDPNKKNGDLYSPLEMCCLALDSHQQEKVSLLMTQMLLEHKNIDVDQLTSFHENMLHISVRNNRSHIVKLLLERDINVNQKNRDGLTPLHFAVKPQFKNLPILKLLLDHDKIAIDTQDNRGNAPIHSISSPEVTRLLYRYGTNVNVQDRLGNTLLHLIVKTPNENMSAEKKHRFLYFLLSAPNTNLNIEDIAGRSAVTLVRDYATNHNDFNVRIVYKKINEILSLCLAESITENSRSQYLLTSELEPLACASILLYRHQHTSTLGRSIQISIMKFLFLSLRFQKRTRVIACISPELNTTLQELSNFLLTGKYYYLNSNKSDGLKSLTTTQQGAGKTLLENECHIAKLPEALINYLSTFIFFPAKNQAQLYGLIKKLRYWNHEENQERLLAQNASEEWTHRNRCTLT